MSSQAEEWDAMNEQTRNEITARVRLMSVIADLERSDYRGRLARASAPSPRALEALRQSSI